MPIKVPDDFVKIRMSENGKMLLAFMPDGTKIPCIRSIDIHSEVGSLVWATITVAADVREIVEYENMISKDIIVQHIVNKDELLKLVNENKDIINGRTG